MNARRLTAESLDSRKRWFARIVLVAVFAVSQLVIWWSPRGMHRELSDSANRPTLVITIGTDQQYGTAHVSIDDKSSMSVDDAVDRLSGTKLPGTVELRVANAVSHGDLEQLRRALVDNTGSLFYVSRFDDFSLSDIDEESVPPEQQEVSR